MCIVYLLSYLDKLTLNYASAYGLKADLHLVGRDYSWVAAASNFGYLLGSYPATIALQKLPMGILVGSMLVGWGAILMLIVAARSFAAIFVLRFILGECVRRMKLHSTDISLSIRYTRSLHCAGMDDVNQYVLDAQGARLSYVVVVINCWMGSNHRSWCLVGLRTHFGRS